MTFVFFSLEYEKLRGVDDLPHSLLYMGKECDEAKVGPWYKLKWVPLPVEEEESSYKVLIKSNQKSA